MTDRFGVKIEEFPDDWWSRHSTCKLLSSLFNRHLVGLLIRGRIQSQPVEKMYTGFPYEHRGEVFWVTAGHIVEKISSAIRDKDFEIIEMRWLDGYPVPDADSIPITNYEDRRMVWILNSDIDFGYIRIRELEAELLKKNDELVTMDVNAIRNPNTISPEGYYIVGYPHEWVTVGRVPTNGGKTKVSYRADLACLPVRRIQYSDIPESLKEAWTKEDNFYGKLLDFSTDTEAQPESIIGMSGGPMLSISRENGSIRYRLNGIQASWGRESRIVQVVPFDRVLSFFDIKVVGSIKID